MKNKLFYKKNKKIIFHIYFLAPLSPDIVACEIISGANNSMIPAIIRNAPINAANTRGLAANVPIIAKIIPIRIPKTPTP